MEKTKEQTFGGGTKRTVFAMPTKKKPDELKRKKLGFTAYMKQT